MTNKFRDKAALMAMQGMLQNDGLNGYALKDLFVQDVFDIADLMLAEHTKRYGVASSTEDTNNLVSSKTPNTVHNDWLPWNGKQR